MPRKRSTSGAASRRSSPCTPSPGATGSTLRICADDHADVVRIEARLADDRDPSDPRASGPPAAAVPAARAPPRVAAACTTSAWDGRPQGPPDALRAGRRHGPGAWRPTRPRAPERRLRGRLGWLAGLRGERPDDLDVRAGRRRQRGRDDGAGARGRRRHSSRSRSGPAPEEAGLEASAALAGRFEGAWDEYVGNWRAVREDRGRSAGRPVPDEDRDLYLTSAAVLRCIRIGRRPARPSPACRSPGATPATTWAATTWSGRGTSSRRRAHSSRWAPTRTARRTLAYLVATAGARRPLGPEPVGRRGRRTGRGVQLDEAAYPILLAGALRGAVPAHMHGRPGVTRPRSSTY